MADDAGQKRVVDEMVGQVVFGNWVSKAVAAAAALEVAIFLPSDCWQYWLYHHVVGKRWKCVHEADPHDDFRAGMVVGTVLVDTA